jgi:MFS family permease
MALARRHPDFRNFMVVRVLLMVAEIASPFYIIYARATLGLPEAMAGTYLTVATVANVLSTYGWGSLSDRTGNRAVLRLVCLISWLPPLLALAMGPLSLVWGATWPSLVAFGLIFALLGASRTGVFIGGLNYLLDLAPADDRSIYIGLTNTVVGVASFAAALGGVIVEVLGYSPLFVLTFALYVAATAFIARTAEPRDNGLTQSQAKLPEPHAKTQRRKEEWNAD